MENPIALVGFGKIARDQHVPALEKSDAFSLAATVDPSAGGIAGTAHFVTLGEMLQGCPGICTVALCTPPQVRFDLAVQALEAGCNVLLEKAPATGAAEMRVLEDLAVRKGVTLFTAWHSRFAHSVGAARDWLVSREVGKVEVFWKEDVRCWHPGQQWIWKAGGPGVFDPGINALSVLTEILPQELLVTAAEFFVPENCDTPIAAEVSMRGVGGFPVRMELDWLHEGAPQWDINVWTDAGRMVLSNGGARMHIDGELVSDGGDREYDRVYRHFADLLERGQSDVDDRPLLLVIDAFFVARRHRREAFVE